MVYYSCFQKEAISLESLRVSAEGVRQEEKRTCCISQAKGQGVINFLRELICRYQLFLFGRKLRSLPDKNAPRGSNIPQPKLR